MMTEHLMLSQNFKLMSDLMKTPGHADPLPGKNQEHVEKIIPGRVFLVSSLRAWIFWRVFKNIFGEPVGTVMP